VIVDCAHYRGGQRQHEGPMDLDRAAETSAQGESGFVWPGLFEPDPGELREVQHRFRLHDLAVEDAQNFHLRPKLEQLAGRAQHGKVDATLVVRRRRRGGRVRRGVGLHVEPDS
jgi:Mg2+ and Co2+ transporter CorA